MKTQVSKRLGKTAQDHDHITWKPVQLSNGKVISCGICTCLNFWKDLHGEDEKTRAWWLGFNPPRKLRLATESIVKRIERRKKRKEARNDRPRST